MDFCNPNNDGSKLWDDGDGQPTSQNPENQSIQIEDDGSTRTLKVENAPIDQDIGSPKEESGNAELRTQSVNGIREQLLERLRRSGINIRLPEIAQDDHSDEEERDYEFASARNVYERSKYPKKRQRGPEEEGVEDYPTEDAEDSTGGSESDSPASSVRSKKVRSAIYRHATGSTYYLHSMYKKMRGGAKGGTSIGHYKPVVDANSTNRTPIYPGTMGNRTPTYQAEDMERENEEEPKRANEEKPKLAKFGSRQNSGMNPNDGDDERQRLVEIVENEILDTKAMDVKWDDIAGLGSVKKIIQEIVVWPMLRPELFNGLRAPPKGLLLFGPPGTGKTTVGRCIASQAKATFYCISASSLTSKWVGENEKLVRALFESVRSHQPAVVFVDEVDALLSNRVAGEHDSTRRLKTQFFTELDGAKSFADERILVVGATNRPDDLDDAARRRFTKRLYIPLPDYTGRFEMIRNLLKNETHMLTDEGIKIIAERTDGFSCDDLKKLCQEAALGPMRRLTDIASVKADEVPPILEVDFDDAIRFVRPSVGHEQLAQYEEFDRRYGSGGSF